MLTNYDELMSLEPGEIIASPRLTLNLLKIASLVLLAGSSPRGCSASITKYYSQLNMPGIRAKIQTIMEKTCKMKPGLVYVAREAKHFSDANMDDATAIRLLDAGILKPEQFIKLPVRIEAEKPKAAAKPAKKHKDIL